MAHWSYGRDFEIVIFKCITQNSSLGTRCEMALTNEKMNASSGNGPLLSGNKLLSEPMLTQIYFAKWHK